MRWFIGILINAVLFISIAGFLDESFYVSSFGAAVAASVILSILNIFVRPILIIFTLPVTIFSLGLFLFVINAITLVLTDKIMGSSFEIASFGTALLMAIVMSLANIIIQKAVFESREK